MSTTVTKVPASDGTSLNWTALGGGNRYVEIDEGTATYDSETSYIKNTYSGGSSNTMFRADSAYSIPTSEIAVDKVTITSVARVETASTNYYNRITCGTTAYASSDFGNTIGTSYSPYTTDWLTNPVTSAAWTPDEVNATDATTTHRLIVYGADGFGVRGRPASGIPDMRVTAIDISVTYSAAAVGHPARKRLGGIPFAALNRGVW